jgi:hypothetical protein
MSYSRNYRGLFGLGLVAGDTYPSNAPFIGGFQVVGLPASEGANAVRKLREALAASFSVGRISEAPTSGADRGRATVGWGPAYGVPTGRLYAGMRLTRDGVTGAEIDAAFAAVARDLRTRLGGLVVNITNTHASGGATPLPALTPDVGPDGNPAPVDPGGDGGGLSPLAIGGIALGGIAAVGLLAVILMRRPVARNPRRVSRSLTRKGRIARKRWGRKADEAMAVKMLRDSLKHVPASQAIRSTRDHAYTAGGHPEVDELLAYPSIARRLLAKAKRL